MPLVCRDCGTVNQDPPPGVDPRSLYCGACAHQSLQRVPSEEDKRRLVSAIAGASLLGLATENPFGALAGAILGYIFGDRLFK